MLFVQYYYIFDWNELIFIFKLLLKYRNINQWLWWKLEILYGGYDVWIFRRGRSRWSSLRGDQGWLSHWPMMKKKKKREERNRSPVGLAQNQPSGTSGAFKTDNFYVYVYVFIYIFERGIYIYNYSFQGIGRVWWGTGWHYWREKIAQICFFFSRACPINQIYQGYISWPRVGQGNSLSLSLLRKVSLKQLFFWKKYIIYILFNNSSGSSMETRANAMRSWMKCRSRGGPAVLYLLPQADLLEPQKKESRWSGDLVHALS